MTSVRRRIPFLAATDDGDDDRTQIVLDETEQEDLISSLHLENTQSTARARLLLDAVLAFSVSLHVVYLLKDSRDSPLAALFPPAVPDSIPWPVAFTFYSICIHAQLLFRLHPSLSAMPYPVLYFPYPVLYLAAGIAPTLSLLLARTWQTTLWAAVPALVVAITHSVHSTMQEGDAALAELELLKYRAPGA
ncbi:hypothetical protein GGX14DRAFT_108055 [Mycena pura]|uniref:Uncharacterized protein n=1 Tax=Mycena pura TaxID=153505 RepID=A0AAD6VDD3_9AGAR|nr:hypothetical protein GGX14DRAFT_108055 [Mycena pura]